MLIHSFKQDIQSKDKDCNLVKIAAYLCQFYKTNFFSRNGCMLKEDGLDLVVNKSKISVYGNFESLYTPLFEMF